MQKRGRERAIVGEQEESCRVHVESADRVEPLADPREQHARRRPPLRIAEGADDTAGLVEKHGAARRRPARDPLAIDGDRITGRVGPLAELAHHDPVHADAAGADQVLGVAAGRHPGGAQDLL
jgi:hypothetical protein